MEFRENAEAVNPAIGIYYEHPEWFRTLFQTLDHRGVAYEKIDDKGLHINIDGFYKLLEVDNIVICAGQECSNALFEPLKAAGISTHMIGGAYEALELDAKRAIDQGSRLAATL